MGNGNSDMTMKVMQQITLQTNQTNQMVNDLGKMANQQAKMLEGMNNIMGNLTGLSMLLNCMQVAQLEAMDYSDKHNVMDEYQELCKKFGVKPLTGEIVPDSDEIGDTDDKEEE